MVVARLHWVVHGGTDWTVGQRLVGLQDDEGEGTVRRIAFTMALLGAVMVAAPAMAQTETIIIEIDGTTRGAEGSITTIAELAVDPAMVGTTCTGTTQTTNNASEHPNNDFILSSGTSTAVILDWEREAGVVVTTSMTLVLGDTITVELRLGPAEVSSGMVVITLTCAQSEPPPTTTTTTTTTLPPPPATTTTTTTTTTPATTTTTEPPPEGGVSAGGGSMAAASGGLGALLLGAGFLAGTLALVVVTPAFREGLSKKVNDRGTRG